MREKQLFKFQINYFFKSLSQIILVILGIIMFGYFVSGNYGTVNVSGIDVILIFSMSTIVSSMYQSYYSFWLQNGFSKRMIFKMMMIMTGFTAICCAFVTLILSVFNYSYLSVPSLIVNRLIIHHELNIFVQIMYICFLIISFILMLLNLSLLVLKVGKKVFLIGMAVTYFVFIVTMFNTPMKFLFDLFYLMIGYDFYSSSLSAVNAIVVNIIISGMLGTIFYFGHQCIAPKK